MQVKHHSYSFFVTLLRRNPSWRLIFVFLIFIPHIHILQSPIYWSWLNIWDVYFPCVRRTVETNRTLWGSWAQKLFCVPFSEFQRAGSSSCSSGKEGGAETREEQSGNNSADLGQGPGAPSRDTHNNIFERFCRTKTPNKWKMWTTWYRTLYSREGHSWTFTTWCQMISLLKECRPCKYPDPHQKPCPLTLKLLTKPPCLGHTVLKALAHCGTLCLAKQQSYSFLLHPKVCLRDLIQCQGTEAGFSFTVIDNKDLLTSGQDGIWIECLDFITQVP